MILQASISAKHTAKQKKVIIFWVNILVMKLVIKSCQVCNFRKEENRSWSTSGRVLEGGGPVRRLSDISMFASDKRNYGKLQLAAGYLAASKTNSIALVSNMNTHVFSESFWYKIEGGGPKLLPELIRLHWQWTGTKSECGRRKLRQPRSGSWGCQYYDKESSCK